MTLASTPRVDLYAVVGGAAEKCIAGAPDNGFKAEPVQLSVAAGVGVRYKLSDRFALFAEPLVSHHLIRSLRLNLENRTCHEFESLVWSTYDLLTLKTVQ